MGAQLTKDAIDIGIVVRDKDAALKFYRDALGFEFVEETDMGGGTLMQRLNCGNTLVKLLTFAKAPEAAAAPGGPMGGATGYRYWTIFVSNLEELVGEVKAAGYNVPWDIREIRPGVTIAMVEDPDGNWVELIQG